MPANVVCTPDTSICTPDKVLLVIYFPTPNSVLQCLTNTDRFHEFLISSGSVLKYLMELYRKLLRYKPNLAQGLLGMFLDRVQ